MTALGAALTALGVCLVLSATFAGLLAGVAALASRVFDDEDGDPWTTSDVEDSDV